MELYDSRFQAYVETLPNSDSAEVLKQRARYRDADLRPILRARRRITFYPDGNLIEIGGSDDYEPHEQTRKRGKVGGFSAKSRSRLLTLCSKLERTALPLFLTLTWPGEWSPDPKNWKRCLDAFGKRMRRAYPDASGIWKLEPQERGAPHYHILVFGISFIPHQVIARWWFEIVGSGDERHLQAGIQIRAVKTRQGVMSYASKLYMGKETAAMHGVGRFWGAINRAKLPRSREVCERIAEPVLMRFQRIARRWIQSRAKAAFLQKRAQGKRVRFYRYRRNLPARIMTDAPAQWIRLLEWALAKYYDDMEKAGHPF